MKKDMNKNATLEDNQSDISDSFKNTRERYGMSQKKWAEAIGISYSLVKKIEAHTIAYSPKTQDKVNSFVSRHPILSEEYKLHGLKDYILFDIFRDNIGSEIRLENIEAVYKCIRHFQDLASNAKQCSSMEELSCYFDFLQQLLHAAKLVSDDNMELIKSGNIPTDMGYKIESAIRNIVTARVKHSGKSSQIEGQSNFFDIL